MSGLFGGVLGDPSERVKATFIRDLELRRNDPNGVDRFSGYVYRGGADLVLKHGKFRQGRRIPEQYEHLIGVPNECTNNAAMAAQTDSSLRYCEGYYTTGFGSPQLHAWCVAPDDGVVELTIPTNRPGIRSAETHMEFLPPEHWGYYGVIFDLELVFAHGESLGLPMLDRSASELAHSRLPMEAVECPHDHPILKVPYDPQRKEVPT